MDAAAPAALRRVAKDDLRGGGAGTIPAKAPGAAGLATLRATDAAVPAALRRIASELLSGGVAGRSAGGTGTISA